MRKHITWFFSALLFLFACNNDTNGIIKQDEMVHLLADVHLIDGSLTSQVTNDSLYKYGTGRYFYLFKQYHTDSAQFKKSVKYYTTQPEIMVKMYQEIDTLLQRKSDSLNKILAVEADKKHKALAIEQKKVEKLQKQKDKLKQDSINKAKLNPVVPTKKKKVIRHKKTKTVKKNINKNALP